MYDTLYVTFVILICFVNLHKNFMIFCMYVSCFKYFTCIDLLIFGQKMKHPPSVEAETPQP